MFDLPIAALCAMLMAATPHGDGRAHVVRKGDTLWDLAQARGCTVAQVRKANGLKPGDLKVGMRLRLPTCKTAPARTHTVSRGDTLSAIAKAYRVSVDALRQANRLDSDVIRVGQRLSVPSGAAAVVPTIRMVKGQSVGSPQRGKLVEPERLPQSKKYYRRRLARTYAAAHVVDQVTAAVEAVAAKHPKAGRLAVGDLSDEDGGFLSGHNSHQSGRDVDLGFYFIGRPQGYPKEFVAASEGTLDVAAMWTLIDTLAEQSKKPGGPTKIFLDYRVQRRIYKHARKQGVSAKRLKTIFSYPDGHWAKGRLVQHIRNHHDHVHVRYGCPPKDERCKE
ncbi:MAG: penicillin-insensitive murein endopeptidase [Nannocystaceae bacterium]|nr:penicillin-insensitive murein endopeptidase [bacterium]